jgi:hypothetical protein
MEAFGVISLPGYTAHADEVQKAIKHHCTIIGSTTSIVIDPADPINALIDRTRTPRPIANMEQAAILEKATAILLFSPRKTVHRKNITEKCKERDIKLYVVYSDAPVGATKSAQLTKYYTPPRKHTTFIFK